MKKLTLLISILLACSLPGTACFCTFSGSFVKVAEESELVVVGTITKKRNSAIQVKIETILKGDTKSEIIEINGDKGGDSCYEVLLPYKEGEQYALAVSTTGGEYYLSHCGEYKLRAENGIVSGMVNNQFMVDATSEWPEYNERTMELSTLIDLFAPVSDIQAPCGSAKYYEENKNDLAAADQAKKDESLPSEAKLLEAESAYNVPLMTQYSSDPEIFETDGYKKAIGMAASTGNIDMVKAAVQNGYDVNAHSEDGLPLLAEAAKYPEIIKYLLLNGANPNQASKNHVTPLMRAADVGCLTNLKLLLKYGADPTYKSGNGYNAVKFAKKYNEVNPSEVVDLLKNYGK
ncbi:MAG: ankyrin repeat domain-containing protein [Marinoscillum sp.]